MISDADQFKAMKEVRAGNYFENVSVCYLDRNSKRQVAKEDILELFKLCDNFRNNSNKINKDYIDFIIQLETIKNNSKLLTPIKGFKFPLLMRYAQDKNIDVLSSNINYFKKAIDNLINYSNDEIIYRMTEDLDPSRRMGGDFKCYIKNFGKSVESFDEIKENGVYKINGSDKSITSQASEKLKITSSLKNFDGLYVLKYNNKFKYIIIEGKFASNDGGAQKSNKIIGESIFDIKSSDESIDIIKVLCLDGYVKISENEIKVLNKNDYIMSVLQLEKFINSIYEDMSK